ncbi:hypothetical protein [Myceligenerans pegani]|uniref:DUF998 domain-containing protein n=1 Tax=Myceligenerans pegani TaxID=2776917 RepID=A0ABR9MTW9_9MICO|nr:hypothetical protein [Myceligenerans sp. TRM 65318]MBE1874207.1 hypothetical protein [Myceligenerans sp. TRM 65318]MBE3016479.1 hypothetical protein [Myceligenerans sp. TRM 65318]
MDRSWIGFAAAVASFAAVWTSVGLLQSGVFNIKEARNFFIGLERESFPPDDVAMIDDLGREGVWQVVGGVLLLVVALIALRWARSGLVAAGAALVLVSLVGAFAMLTETLPVVFMIDFALPGSQSVAWSPTTSDTEFLASGVGIVVGVALAVAGVLAGTRRPASPWRERVLGAGVGVLVAVGGTLSLAAGVLMNYWPLAHMEEVWPTSGLWSLREEEPFEPGGALLMLLGVALVAGALWSVRWTSIGVWIAAGLWVVLAVATFTPTGVPGAGDNVVSGGIVLVGAWFGVLALIAATLGLVTHATRMHPPGQAPST